MNPLQLRNGKIGAFKIFISGEFPGGAWVETKDKLSWQYELMPGKTKNQAIALVSKLGAVQERGSITYNRMRDIVNAVNGAV